MKDWQKHKVGILLEKVGKKETLQILKTMKSEAWEINELQEAIKFAEGGK